MILRGTLWLATLLLGLTAVLAQAAPFVDGASRADRQSVQAALTLELHYEGAIDGSWGPQSEAAFQAYVRDSGARNETQAMQKLMADFAQEWQSSGWEVVVDASEGPSFVAPFALFSESKPPRLLESYNFSTKDFTLRLFAMRGRDDVTEKDHNVWRNSHGGDEKPLLIDKPKQRITGVETWSGERVHIRSDFIDWGFRTIVVRAKDGQFGRHRLIAASLNMSAPEGIAPPTSGPLAGGPAPQITPQVTPQVTPRTPNPLQPQTDVPTSIDLSQIGSALGGGGLNQTRPSTTTIPPDVAAPVTDTQTPTPQAPDLDPTQYATAVFVNDTDVITSSVFLELCDGLSLSQGGVLTLLARDPRLGVAAMRSSKPGQGALSVSGQADLGDNLQALGAQNFPQPGRQLAEGPVTAIDAGGMILEDLSAEGLEDLPSGHLAVLAKVPGGAQGWAMLDRTGALAGLLTKADGGAQALAVSGDSLTGFLTSAGVPFQTATPGRPAIGRQIPPNVDAAVSGLLCALR